MSKVLIDRKLLERLAECAETANRTKYAEAVYDLLTQPAADCGLEVVAWRIGLPNGAGYEVYEQHQPWAYEQYETPPFITYEVQDLVRKSDADARIAELEAQLNQRIETICQMQMELDGVKAQEPVAYGRWAEGLPKGTRLMRYDGTPLVDYKPSESFDVPLYAAPVAKQEAISRDEYRRIAFEVTGMNEDHCFVADELDQFVARLNGGKPNE